MLEPGRFLVGPAGAYLARVVDTKTVDGTSIAILDGGVHHVLRPALVGTEHRVRLFGASSGRPAPVTVAGPLCSGLDVLATGAVMAPPTVGDLMAVLDVGAYGFTESMPVLPVAPDPGRGGRVGRRGGAHPAAGRSRVVAGRAGDPGSRQDRAAGAGGRVADADLGVGHHRLDRRARQEPVNQGRDATGIIEPRHVAGAVDQLQGAVRQGGRERPPDARVPGLVGGPVDEQHGRIDQPECVVVEE